MQAESPWAREIARRMQILATYDGHETGVSEDNIDGGFVVNADWFKIAHPMALKHLLGTIAWMPEEFGPGPREPHRAQHGGGQRGVVRSARQSRTVPSMPRAPTIDVLRLAFLPERISGRDPSKS